MQKKLGWRFITFTVYNVYQALSIALTDFSLNILPNNNRSGLNLLKHFNY